MISVWPLKNVKSVMITQSRSYSLSCGYLFLPTYAHVRITFLASIFNKPIFENIVHSDVKEIQNKVPVLFVRASFSLKVEYMFSLAVKAQSRQHDK